MRHDAIVDRCTQVLLFLLLCTAPAAGQSRWSHGADGDSHPTQTRTRTGEAAGPADKWPVDCKTAEEKCKRNIWCMEELQLFLNACNKRRFTEESCDACRLAAVNISDLDDGFAYLKCDCASDRACRSRRQPIDDCLAEMVL